MAERSLKHRLELAYHGRSRKATRFRYALIAFDLFTIGFFLVTTPMEAGPGVLAADFVIGTAILADFLARLWIAPNKLRMLLQIYTLADVLVVASLLLAPLVTESLAFLRVLRALRLLHSYHVLRDLRRETPFFRHHEDVIVGAVNLAVFVFVVTALVFTLQGGESRGIESYLDALYFTVAALTTTGFGDITLQGTDGRLLSVVIMIVGVALFLRLAQAIFRPSKVHHKCPDCGLNRHDPDAIHCKHCGRTLKIESEGES